MNYVSGLSILELRLNTQGSAVRLQTRLQARFSIVWLTISRCVLIHALSFSDRFEVLLMGVCERKYEELDSGRYRQTAIVCFYEASSIQFI